jgi:3-isopropylmalate dehydratase small subunit
MITGRVWKYGDHVNTDLIIPGRYLDNYDPQHLAAHAMEDLDPQFSRLVSKGDMVLGGRNFGCGSSREQAPIALRTAGVSAIIAVSAARIFLPQRHKCGVPSSYVQGGGDPQQRGHGRAGHQEGDRSEHLYREIGDLHPPPPFLLDILESGGWYRT